MSMEDPAPSRARAAAGFILTAVGALIAVVAGIGGLGALLVFAAGADGVEPKMFLVILMFGGPPFLIGYGLFRLGRRLSGRR